MCFLIQFIDIISFFLFFLLYFACRFALGSSVSLYLLIKMYPSIENKIKNFFCRKSFAVAIVIASLAGPQWLLTEEKIRNLNYNGTSNYNIIDDGFYITKYTKSSLWILCFAQGNCFIFFVFCNFKLLNIVLSMFLIRQMKHRNIFI